MHSAAGTPSVTPITIAAMAICRLSVNPATNCGESPIAANQRRLYPCGGNDGTGCLKNASQITKTSGNRTKPNASAAAAVRARLPIECEPGAVMCGSLCTSVVEYANARV